MLNVILFIVSTIILVLLGLYRDHPLFNNTEYKTVFPLTPTQRWYSLLILVIVGYLLSFWLMKYESKSANMYSQHQRLPDIYNYSSQSHQQQYQRLPTQYEYMLQRQNDQLKQDTVEGLKEWKEKHQVKVNPTLKSRFEKFVKSSKSNKPLKSKSKVIYGKLP